MTIFNDVNTDEQDIFVALVYNFHLWNKLNCTGDKPNDVIHNVQQPKC